MEPDGREQTGNKGLYVLSTETLEKVWASTSELAFAMADCEPT
jgi:hypothetical protein